MECGVKNAQVFCVCTDTEIYLCEECLLKHYKKRTRNGHLIWQISDMLIYKDPSYFDRLETFPSIKSQAEQGIIEVDKAINLFRALVVQVLQDIQIYSERTIDKLINLKVQLSADVEDALEEVLKTLAEPQPSLHSKYGSALRALMEKPKPFKLFVFTAPSCRFSVKSFLTLQSSLAFQRNFSSQFPLNLLK